MWRDNKKILRLFPALVAEGLSPFAALKGRHTKFSLYESKAIKYCLLISPDTEEAEIYELENGNYRISKKKKNPIHDFFFEDCKAIIDFKEI